MALPRQSIPRSRSGFALIVAVVLMSFILLILLSLSLYSRIEMGTAANQVYLSQARENARLGVLEALAQLQAVGGPDQRVTARAEILEGRGVSVRDENRYWTGVWNVEEDDLLDYSASALTRDSTTGNIDKDNDQVTWLISHDSSVTTVGPQTDLTALQNANGLYGMADLLNYSVGTENVVQQAGRVPVRKNSDMVEGTYAWWVADEGVKAKVNTRDRSQDIESSGTSQTYLKNQLPFLASRKANLSAIDDFAGVLTVNDSTADRLADIGSLENLTSDKADPLQTSKKHIQDISFYSYGVLSDTLHGGLKLDLTRGLDDQWQQFLQTLEPNKSNWVSEWPEPQSIFKAPWPAGYPSASMSYSIPSEDYGIWGPYWDILYQYYNLYKPTIPLYPEIKVRLTKLTKNNDALQYDFTGYKNPSASSPANIADVNDLNPSVEPRGAGPGGGHGTNEPQYESSGYFIPTPEFSKHKPYRGNWFGLPKTVALNRGKQYTEAFRREPLWNQMEPVMIRSQLGFGLSTFETSTPPTVNADGSEDHYFKVRIHLYPAVVLWNPYNVSLQAKDYRITIEPHLKVQLYDGPVTGEGDSISGDWNGDHYYFKGVADPDAGTNWALQSAKRGYPLEELLNENAWGDEVVKSSTTEVYDPRVLSGGSQGYFGGESSSLSLNFVIRQASFEPGEIKIFGLSDGSAGSDIPFSDAELELLEGATTDTGVYVELHQTSEDTQFHAGKRRVAIKEIPIRFEGDPVNPANQIARPDETFYFKFFTNAKDSLYQWTGSQIDFNLSMLDETLTPGNSLEEVDIGGGLTNAQFFDENSDFIKQRSGLLALPIVASSSTASSGGFPRVPPAEKLLIMDWRLKGTALDSDGVPIVSQFSPRRMTANRLYAKVDTPFPETLLGQLYEHHVYGNGMEYPTDGTGDVLYIDSNGSRAFWGEDSSFNSQSQVILYDVPRQPLQSVGALMHANLSFYDTMPAYAVGNSYASPYVPTDASSTWKYIERLESVKTDNYVFADYSYLLNNELFDRFFFSSVPPDYSKGSNQDFASLQKKLPPFEVVNASYIESGKPLPNSSMSYFIEDGESAAETLEKLQGDQALSTAASRLLVDGAFNVNSTSVEAWMAFLAGSAFGPDEYLDFHSVDGGNTRLDDKQLDFPVSRFSYPRASNSGASDSWQWRGFRSMDKDQLKSLAENIVAEVKKRGPFPSMADFVNRRLVSGELGWRGALQAAIDNSVVNDDPLFSKRVSPSGKDSSPYDDTNGMIEANTVAAQAAGIPGWVSQNDVLRVYGPLMTVRSDTFVIRAYGDSIDPLTQQIRGRAWCEAVVQRIPEFVNGVDAPETPINKQSEAHGEWTKNADLMAENQTFGRRFEMVSFRWLNEDEI